MNRKVIFLWGPTATLIILAGGLGLMRMYLAEATELLVAELTGKGARVERIDVGYAPPSVTLYGLRVDTGTERIEVPRVELYPDFSKLLDGEIGLDHAVFDEPQIRAAFSGGSSPVLDLSVLPKSMSIRNASFIADEDGAPSSPVTFSADVEKEAVGFGFVVKNMSIPEFGLTFNGTVDVRSMGPLALAVNAQKGEFNPAQLFDFLRRFNYFDAADLVAFKETRNIAAESFQMDFNGSTGALVFTAGKFTIDESNLSDFAVNIDEKGGWAMTCKEGALDAAQLFSLVQAHPGSQEVLQSGIVGAGLQSLSVEGLVSLKEVQIQGGKGAARPSGKFSLGSQSLKFLLVSEIGEIQDMTLQNFEGSVTLKNGKPQVSIERLDLASSSGGKAFVSGGMPVPFALAGLRFRVEARQLNWFGTTFEGVVEKKDARQIDFDLNMQGAKAEVKANGLARKEFSGSNRWAAVLENLKIQAKGSREQESDELFDFAFVRDGFLSGKIVVRRLQYNDLPIVRDMSVRVSFAGGRMDIKGKGRLCLMKVGLESVLTPDSVAANIIVNGNGVHLPGVLGCFVDELPVYLRGRLTVQATFFMQGKSSKAFRDSARGDVVARVRGMQVFKLSNLDKRLGFFVEILNTAGLEPDQGDTLSFREGLLSATVAEDTILLKTVRLSGGKVSVAGKGDFDMAGKRLQLDAHVVTPFGVNKDVAIDMVLSEERSS